MECHWLDWKTYLTYMGGQSIPPMDGDRDGWDGDRDGWGTWWVVAVLRIR